MTARFAAIVLGSAAGAFAAGLNAAQLDLSACTMPAAPSVPDGATATDEQMLTAQGDVQNYVDAGNASLDCLKGVEASMGEEITPEQQQVLVDTHNGNISDMETVAERWSAAVQAYKAQ